MSPVSINEAIAQERELREQWQKMHLAATAAADISLDKRLNDMNELRRQIESERGQYLLRDSYEREHKELSQRVEEIAISQTSTKSQIWFMGAIITVAASSISILAEIIIRIVWK